MTQASPSPWTAADSAELYDLPRWGAPYYRVSDCGEVEVNLGDERQASWHKMGEMMGELEERGIEAPVMLRFGNILEHRLRLLNESFRKAIQSAGYQGEFKGVFPIKVNQQQQVIEQICEYGKQFHHGLEAGSKPELIAALSYMHDPEAWIVCNGYKDQEFIDLALYAVQMGLQVMLVVETVGEVPLILERAEVIGVKPRLGVRMKLSTPGSGKWVNSGGDNSVFGLNAEQVIQVVDFLKEKDMLSCLELLHYHLGSQIPNIRTIRTGVSEATRVYVDLVREGAKMGYLDMGGGLAVDYDGSQSNTTSSRNYAVEEYCADVVESVMEICDKSNVPHPTLITESGRATVAHYGVLVFNILEVSGAPTKLEIPELPENIPNELKYLSEIPQQIKAINLQECLNDAVYYRDEIRNRFALGLVSLRERSLAERCFAVILRKIEKATKDMERIPDSLEEISAARPDIYYGNFSLFQSLPDNWAIDQLFPIMPIHRLDEQPLHEGIFADITCDCDGKIDHFIDDSGSKNALPLHGLNENETYNIGVFLVGAYQETLGDLHNLFGDTNVVSVEIDEEGHRVYGHEVQGDTVSDVLSYVEYDPKEMTVNFRRLAERAVRHKRISAPQRKVIMQAFTEGMQGYTYFEN
ncbi:biosynthetic arginine decarboxylase [Kiritimatiellaeota bacterium B1221]|nr:biosynthetic arginine decarboxylase [Kiritimatiellaeota bacterium B1221]